MKVMFVSLGCDKNLVDAENMMGILHKKGYGITDDEHEADIIIVNSCCFIGPAKEESIETILEMAKQKEEGRCRALVVTGCLAERYRDEVLSEFPEVDAVVGTTAYDRISEVLEELNLSAAGSARDSSVRDSVTQDSAVRNGAVQDAAYDSAVRNGSDQAAAHDNTVRNDAVQDAAAQDSAVRNGVVQDAAAHDSAVRDSAAEDAVVRGNAAQAAFTGDNAAQPGQSERIKCFDDKNRLPKTDGGRIVTTGGHFAYLKIAEGCSKHCTYCVIPGIRGRYRSIPQEDIISEAEELAARGVRELIVIAQETTLYGTDLYGEKRLPKLLKRLASIPGIEWIRVEYCYPEEITQELVDVIRDEEKICSYLDIPVQHASDSVLKKMGRRATQEELRRIVAWLRRDIPDITLRTTLISGFPQETEADHEELMRFVEDMRFDRLGVFAYSQEENTPAALMDGQIPEEVKAQRRDEIMALQQDISYELSQELVGSVMKVMIEGRLPEEDVYVGRTYRDAPDVDGYIFITSGRTLMTGDFVMARVTGADEYDLTGELIDEPAE